MTKPILIGLHGLARSGKTTIADHLVAKHGFIALSFADPIRDMLEALGLPRAAMDGPAKEEKHINLNFRTPRHAMQTLGTEWGRTLIHPDIWVHALARQIDAHADNHTRIVIPDVRFDNEAAFIRDTGELWHISRPGLERTDHPSEAGIEARHWDTFFLNDSTIDALLSDVDALIAALTQ